MQTLLGSHAGALGTHDGDSFVMSEQGLPVLVALTFRGLLKDRLMVSIATLRTPFHLKQIYARRMVPSETNYTIGLMWATIGGFCCLLLWFDKDLSNCLLKSFARYHVYVFRMYVASL